jgi:chromosome segregation ATPase
VNTNRRQAAKERAARIAAGIEAIDTLMHTLDKAVDQLEAARGPMDMAVAELRGQSYVVKERFNLLVVDFNELRDEVRALKVEASP